MCKHYATATCPLALGTLAGSICRGGARNPSQKVSGCSAGLAFRQQRPGFADHPVSPQARWRGAPGGGQLTVLSSPSVILSVPAPLELRCSDAQVSKGTGRWTSEREWVYDFERDLPPGCAARRTSSLTSSASGAPLKGAASYQFNSGGPLCRTCVPAPYEPIDEEQLFHCCSSTAPATLESVRALCAWCQLDGVGERVPVRLVDGKERAGLLKTQGLERRAAQEPLAVQTLACARRFTPSTKGAAGVGQRWPRPAVCPMRWKSASPTRCVRRSPPEFTCERENAQAACLPIRPPTVTFSARCRASWRRPAAQSRPKRWSSPNCRKTTGASASTPGRRAGHQRAVPGLPLTEKHDLCAGAAQGYRDASGRPWPMRRAFRSRWRWFAAAGQVCHVAPSASSSACRRP